MLQPPRFVPRRPIWTKLPLLIVVTQCRFLPKDEDTRSHIVRIPPPPASQTPELGEITFRRQLPESGGRWEIHYRTTGASYVELRTCVETRDGACDPKNPATKVRHISYPAQSLETEDLAPHFTIELRSCSRSQLPSLPGPSACGPWHRFERDPAERLSAVP